MERRKFNFNFIIIAVFTFIYSSKIIDVVNAYIFKDINVAAFKLTFTKLIFIPHPVFSP